MLIIANRTYSWKLTGFLPCVRVGETAQEVEAPNAGLSFWCNKLIDEDELGNRVHCVHKLEEKIGLSYRVSQQGCVDLA